MIQNTLEVLFYKELTALKELYDKVKSAIILSENFDPNREYYIAPLNQMRNALDHVFNAIGFDEETMSYEIKEAKEHINRAGYDVYEILASNICNDILSKMNTYPLSIIGHVFPEYFQVIKISISNMQVEIGKLRADKKKSSDITFDKYLQNIKDLIDFSNLVNTKLPDLEKYKKREKFKNWGYWLITILLTIGGIIGGRFLK